MMLTMIDTINTTNSALTIDSIEIVYQADECADTSYLSEEENKDRIESLEIGQWGYIGICAQAIVSRSIGGGSRRLETLTSAGLWGIESDSDKDALRSIEEEELCDLKEHLSAFGVDTSDFEDKARIANTIYR